MSIAPTRSIIKARAPLSPTITNMEKKARTRDWTKIPTAELPTIVASPHLGLETRERAMKEFADRLSAEEENFMEFMCAMVKINECTVFHNRAKGLMDLLDEKMKKQKAKQQHSEP